MHTGSYSPRPSPLDAPPSLLDQPNHERSMLDQTNHELFMAYLDELANEATQEGMHNYN